jgi:DNA-binding NarL/FixJ family response regulator
MVMEEAKTRVLLVDDHPLIRAGFRALLSTNHCEVVGEAGTADEAMAFATANRVDLAIVDLILPGRDGFDLTPELIAIGVRVIVVSQYRDTQTVRKALAAGANGYVPKTVDQSELLQAISTVARGEVWISPSVGPGLVDQMRQPKSETPQLTPRQLEVLQLIVEGKSTKEIAAALTLGIKTVETHRAQIMERLGIKNVAALVRYALEHKLVK